MSFDEEVALTFLETVFSRCPEDEWVSVFAIDRAHTEAPQKVLWGEVGRLGRLIRQIAPLVETHCVWYGVATRIERLSHGRGGIDDCAHLPAFFADIDTLGPNHKATNYPPDEAAVRLFLDQLPPPSLVVRTGGGYHPYWLLDEPLVMPEAGIALRQWGATIMAKASAVGYKLDDVYNIDRILRLAGSVNAKQLPTVVPVTISETI